MITSPQELQLSAPSHFRQQFSNGAEGGDGLREDQARPIVVEGLLG